MTPIVSAGTKIKMAVVADWDGVLGQDDIAAEFWKNRNLENEYWALAKRVQQNRNRAYTKIDADLQPHWSAAHGLSLKIMMERHVQHLQESGRRLHVSELEHAADAMRLTPGARALVDFLKKHPQIRDRIYINSSAYEPIVKKLAERVGIPKENVFGTPVLTDDAGFVTGVGKVNGGINKMDALAKIVRKSRVPRRNWIVLGDSKGDLPLMAHVAGKGGLAIWFNPTDAITGQIGKESGATTAIVSSRNLKSVIPLVRAAARSNRDDRPEALHNAIRKYNRYARRSLGMMVGQRVTNTYAVGNQTMSASQKQDIRKSREKLRGRVATHTRLQ